MNPEQAKTVKTIARACGLEIAPAIASLDSAWLVTKINGVSTSGKWIAVDDYLRSITAMQGALKKQSEDFNAAFSAALAKLAASRDVYVHQLESTDWATVFCQVVAEQKSA